MKRGLARLYSSSKGFLYDGSGLHKLLLEADANPRDPKKQEELLAALIHHKNPQMVIDRFQKGSYAMNDSCSRYFMDAMLMSSQGVKHDFANHQNSFTATVSSPFNQEKTEGDKQRWFSSQDAKLVFSGVVFGIAVYNIYDAYTRRIDEQERLWFRDTMAPYNWSNHPQRLEEPKRQEESSSPTSHSIGRLNQTSNVTFDDVQGCEEAKEEMQELVAFLKDPERFRRLNATLPRGILLTGPPGVGKTYLAKAVAGEANVPFISCSGSEFDEKYVGVGAGRIRSLFELARKHKPCIIFIDEIDSVAGKRTNSDQKHANQSINQLLTELDGFNELDDIVLLAATNFPDVIDDAILRPGRFDKKIVMMVPDLKGRKSILEAHLKKRPVSDDLDLSFLAKASAGKTGADLKNIVNIASIYAAMDNSMVVTQNHLETALEDCLMGKERKHAQISDEVKNLTAFHESGHVVVSLFTRGSDPIKKATIVPRGNALGYVAKIPDEDKNMTKEKLLASLDCCMGGRIAEELIFGPDNVTPGKLAICEKGADLSKQLLGAISDFQQATAIAETMVRQYGMNDKVGFRSIYGGDKLSESMKAKVDQEVSKILEESRNRVTELLRQNEHVLYKVAHELLDKNTLTGDEISKLAAENQHAKNFQ